MEISGRCALVTGASSGIGKALALGLASRGANVVLLARRKDRLESLAQTITSDYAVKADVLALDLAAADAAEQTVAALADRNLAIDILVNNAGFGLRGRFADLDPDRQMAMVRVNVDVLTDLTRRLLPPMLDKGEGGILNVASTAAFQAGPNMAVYYASKAYVLLLSEALHEELKGHGIAVTCLCPGATRTEFADVADMHGTKLFRWMNGPVEPVAEAGLRALEKGRAVCIPGMLNKMLAQGVRFQPRVVVRRLAMALQS